jgi:hypothetical protein
MNDVAGEYMASKRRNKGKKRKSRTMKRAATAVLAASVGAAACLSHEKDHVELVQAQPDTAIELLTDVAIVATSTAVAAVMPIAGSSNQPK